MCSNSSQFVKTSEPGLISKTDHHRAECRSAAADALAASAPRGHVQAVSICLTVNVMECTQMKITEFLLMTTKVAERTRALKSAGKSPCSTRFGAVFILKISELLTDCSEAEAHLTSYPGNASWSAETGIFHYYTEY